MQYAQLSITYYYKKKHGRHTISREALTSWMIQETDDLDDLDDPGDG